MEKLITKLEFVKLSLNINKIRIKLKFLETPLSAKNLNTFVRTYHPFYHFTLFHFYYFRLSSFLSPCEWTHVRAEFFPIERGSRAAAFPLTTHICIKRIRVHSSVTRKRDLYGVVCSLRSSG